MRVHEGCSAFVVQHLHDAQVERFARCQVRHGLEHGFLHRKATGKMLNGVGACCRGISLVLGERALHERIVARIHLGKPLEFRDINHVNANSGYQ